MRRGYQRRSRGPIQIETEGKTLEEAVQAAMRKLHVKREDLDYEVIEAARGGFLGLGSRPARIRARARSGGGSSARQGGRQDRGSTPPRSGRATDGDSRRRVEPRRQGRHTSAESRVDDGTEKREIRNAEPQETRHRGRDSERRERLHEDRRGGRHGTDRRRVPNTRRPGDAGERPARATTGRHLVENDDSSTGRRQGRTDNTERRDRTHAATAPAQESIEAVQEFTKELLGRMGYPSDVGVSWEEDSYNVQVSSQKGDEALIGDGGETLDALQHIVAKMSSRGLERLNPVRINIGGFRERREEELSRLALQYGHKVKETGEEVVTEPLRAAERRIIHRTLMDDPEVITQALGNGLIKRVWIGPPGGEERADVPCTKSTDRPEREDGSAKETGRESLSMIDDWDAPASGSSTEEVPEWGRRRKPAKGRRR